MNVVVMMTRILRMMNYEFYLLLPWLRANIS
jgi:hypothetical protein